MRGVVNERTRAQAPRFSSALHSHPHELLLRHRLAIVGRRGRLAWHHFRMPFMGGGLRWRGASLRGIGTGASHILLEIGARFPWIRFAAERTIAMRGKADRRGAVWIHRACDLIPGPALAAIGTGSLDQRIGDDFDLVLRM